MRLITTNYINDIQIVDIKNCRIYKTDCNDTHFVNIISANREMLTGDVINTPTLFVLMDNEHIENTTNYYASISFKKNQRGKDTIYQICILTKEKEISNDLFKGFLFNVFQYLSLDTRIRIALSDDTNLSTYNIQTDEHINKCIEKLSGLIGINN